MPFLRAQFFLKADTGNGKYLLRIAQKRSPPKRASRIWIETAELAQSATITCLLKELRDSTVV